MSTRCYLRQTSSVRVAVTAFTFSLHLLYTAQVLAQAVTCEVPLVEPFASTSVTCHFPEDVSETKRDFSIVLYQGKNHQNQQDILNCWWLKGRMRCVVSSGYRYNRRISHELTLEIPQVSSEHIGAYVCKLSNMDYNHIKPCELKVELAVESSSCSMPSVQELESTTLTCRFSANINVNRRNFRVVHLGDENKIDAVIVSCTWLKYQEIDCTTTPGYEFNKTVTDQLVISVPRASRDQTGTYACHVMDSDTENFKPCEFIVTHGKSTSIRELLSKISVGLGAAGFLLSIVTCVIARRRIASHFQHVMSETDSDTRPPVVGLTELQWISQGYSLPPTDESPRD